MGEIFNLTSNVTGKDIPEWVFKFFGSYLLVASVLGLVANGTCLFIFSKYNHLRSPTSIFIIGLLSTDLGMSIFGSPWAAASTFSRGLLWGFPECIYQGVIVYFCGISSMYILATIAYSRYALVTKPLVSYSLDNTKASVSLICCFILGLFWSLIPFSGWTRYEPEGLGTTCAVAYDSSSMKVLSYNITIFFFCFLIPIIIIVYSYINIFKKIRHMNHSSVWIKQSRIMKKKIKLERKLSRTVVIMISSFLISWTPYAVVSFWRAFGLGKLSPIVTAVPSIFAKSSSVWNPFIYAFSCTEFRKVLLELIPFLNIRRQKTTSTQSTPYQETEELVTVQPFKTSFTRKAERKL